MEIAGTPSSTSDATNQHRQLIVIEGEKDWCIQSVAPYLNQYNSVLYISSQSPSNGHITAIEAHQYHHHLGREYDCVVYDGYSDLRPNALMALSGVVKMAGVMLLILPPLSNFLGKTNKGVERQWLYNALKNNQYTRWQSKEGNDLGASLPPITNNRKAILETQAQAIEKVIKVASGRRNRPLVLTADRGRGKTSVLGMSAADLLLAANHVIICAPAPATVQKAFEHATDRLLNHHSIAPHQFSANGQNIHYKTHSIQYFPPDRLLEILPEANLLIVDEAAAIPTQLLLKIIPHYHRVVFSTTIHGYEGSGRGFELRFLPRLKAIYPDVSFHRLEQPIRWLPGDPLEEFWQQCFLCYPAAKTQHAVEFNTDEIRLIKFDHFIAMENRTLLHQAFNLLVNAHYQTTPEDLWRILTGEHQLFLAYQNSQLVGALVGCPEGNFQEQSLISAITAGERRVKGHLLPQQLLLHYQDEAIAQQAFFRVVRIAVDPEYQHQGLGTAMLQQLNSELLPQFIIGSAFSANAGLLSFWLKAGFSIVKLGTRKDAASGEHSVIVLKSGSRQQHLVDTLNHEFSNDIEHQLIHYCRQLCPELIAVVLSQTIKTKPLSTRYHHLLQRFLAGGSLDIALPAVRQWCLQSETWFSLPVKAQSLLVEAIVLAKPLNELKGRYAITGKKAFQERIRKIVSSLQNDR